MVVLTIETFKTDKVTAISVNDKSSGGSNYKSVKFAYDGGDVPLLCIDGDFKLFRFRNKNGNTYSLSITCDSTNESFFKELSEVIANESYKILKDKSIKPEDFELIRDNRSGRSVYANNNKKRSHTQLDSRKQVIAFQDRVITINIKEAQHPLKREKQVIDKSSIMLKISTKSMHRVLV